MCVISCSTSDHHLSRIYPLMPNKDFKLEPISLYISILEPVLPLFIRPSGSNFLLLHERKKKEQREKSLTGRSLRRFLPFSIFHSRFESMILALLKAGTFTAYDTRTCTYIERNNNSYNNSFLKISLKSSLKIHLFVTSIVSPKETNCHHDLKLLIPLSNSNGDQ